MEGTLRTQNFLILSTPLSFEYKIAEKNAIRYVLMGDVNLKLWPKYIVTRLFLTDIWPKKSPAKFKASWFRTQGPHRGQSYIQTTILDPYKVLKMIEESFDFHPI
jgi:hypothetical protein